jgi:hypothetical protein
MKPSTKTSQTTRAKSRSRSISGGQVLGIAVSSLSRRHRSCRVHFGEESSFLNTVHRRYFRTAFEELGRVHPCVPSGCACSAQGTETGARDIGMRLNVELHQGQETEPGQYSKLIRDHRTCSLLRLQMNFGVVQGSTGLDLVNGLNARVFSNWSILLLVS